MPAPSVLAGGHDWSNGLIDEGYRPRPAFVTPHHLFAYVRCIAIRWCPSLHDGRARPHPPRRRRRRRLRRRRQSSEVEIATIVDDHDHDHDDRIVIRIVLGARRGPQEHPRVRTRRGLLQDFARAVRHDKDRAAARGVGGEGTRHDRGGEEDRLATGRTGEPVFGIGGVGPRFDAVGGTVLRRVFLLQANYRAEADHMLGKRAATTATGGRRPLHGRDDKEPFHSVFRGHR